MLEIVVGESLGHYSSVTVTTFDPAPSVTCPTSVRTLRERAEKPETLSENKLCFRGRVPPHAAYYSLYLHAPRKRQHPGICLSQVYAGTNEETPTYVQLSPDQKPKELRQIKLRMPSRSVLGVVDNCLPDDDAHPFPPPRPHLSQITTHPSLTHTAWNS